MLNSAGKHKQEVVSLRSAGLHFLWLASLVASANVGATVLFMVLAEDGLTDWERGGGEECADLVPSVLPFIFFLSFKTLARAFSFTRSSEFPQCGSLEEGDDLDASKYMLGGDGRACAGATLTPCAPGTALKPA